MSSLEGPVLTAQDGGLKVMGLCRKLLYWQGLWKEDPEPDLEFYLQYFSPWFAHLLTKYRYLRMTVKVLRHVYIWITLSNLVVIIVVQSPMAIISLLDTKADIVMNVYYIAVYSQLLVAALTTTYHRYNHQYYICAMEVLSRPGQLDVEEQKILENGHVLCHKIPKYLHLFLVPAVTLIVSGVAIFYLRPNRMLFYILWYPWDATTSHGHATSLCIQTATYISLFLMANTLISSACCRFIYLNTFFDILPHKIKHIREKSIQNIKRRKLKESELFSLSSIIIVQEFRGFEGLELSGPALRGDWLRAGRAGPNTRRTDNLELSPLYEPGNVLLRAERVVAGPDRPADSLVEGGDWLRAARAGPNTRRTDNLELSPVYEPGNVLLRAERVEVGPDRQADTLVEVGEETVSEVMDIDTVGDSSVSELEGITDEELDKEMQILLAVVVELHVTLVQLTNEIGCSFNLYLIVFFVTNVVLLGLSAIIILNGDLNTMIAFIITVFSIEVTLTYLMFNVMGNIIADQNDAVRDEIYGLDWTGASPSFKRSMLIMMSRANVPLEIKPTGLDPLSLKNFAEVSKIAYKMISTLNTLAE